MKLLLIAALVAGCVDTDEVETETVARSAHAPFGYARVRADGSLLDRMDIMSGTDAVSVQHASTGVYTVIFPGFVSSSLDGGGGHADVTAEGTDNNRCWISSWFIAFGQMSVAVHCGRPDGNAANTAFTVAAYQRTMPSVPDANAPTTSAYAWVTGNGEVSPFYDFNSTGYHNTVRRQGPGNYLVFVPVKNWNHPTSVVVTPYAASDPGSVCSSASYGASPIPPGLQGVTISVLCSDRFGNPLDSAFSVAASTQGVIDAQQGAYGLVWWYGPWPDPDYSFTFGYHGTCSPTSMSMTRSGALATLAIDGDFGSLDGNPFRTPMLVTPYWGATPGYCKVESITDSGAVPSAHSQTNIRCYTANGALVATPYFFFAQVTSDAAAPGYCR